MDLLAFWPNPRSHPARSFAPGPGEAPATHATMATGCSLCPCETTFQILTFYVSSRLNQTKQGIEPVSSVLDGLLMLLYLFQKYSKDRKTEGGRKVFHRYHFKGSRSTRRPSQQQSRYLEPVRIENELAISPQEWFGVEGSFLLLTMVVVEILR